MTDIDAAALAGLLEAHRPLPEQPANILRTLLAVQETFGHVPGDTLARIADVLGVTETAVAGVLSYYPDLHTCPRGRHVIRLCMGEACVANRAHHLLEDFRRDFRTGFGETTADGRFTLERVYCLGNCAVGPTVMVDDSMYGRATGIQLREILKSYT